MLDRLRGAYRLSQETTARLDLKQQFKFAARFVHNDALGMIEVLAKAQANKDANQDVIEAVQDLRRGDPADEGSPDLRYLRAIIDKVHASKPEKFENRYYYSALFEKVWKRSVGMGKRAKLLKAPAFQLHALSSAVKNCEARDNDIPKGQALMKLFIEHFDALSSSALWSNQNVKNEDKYFGLPLSIATLRKIAAKEKITAEDVKAIKSSLKIAEKDEIPDDLNDVLNVEPETITDIDLSKPTSEILLQMGKLVAGHYGDCLNIQAGDKEKFDARIKRASSVNDVMNALTDAYDQDLQNTMKSKNWFADDIIDKVLSDFLHPAQQQKV
jgi:hypothetical protein